MRHKVALTALASGALLLTGALPATAAGGHGCQRTTVGAGQTWVVTSTTRLCALTLASGGSITAPTGKDVVLVVDGVQRSGVVNATGGTTTVLPAGSWRGDVELQVVDATTVDWQGLTFVTRQALAVADGAVVTDRSVTAAIDGGRVTGSSASGVQVRSTGENFGGVAVSGGTYALNGSTFHLVGNGRSDFIGDGAAIAATDGAKVTVDGVRVDNTGADRLGVWVSGGANVTVKNSSIATHDGTLPAGYQPTVDLAYMQSAPWMLGISGDVRATNLMGDNSTASYVGSSISSTGWGVLSTDSGSNARLTAIDSTVTLTGSHGYGSYAIGAADEQFLGTRFDTADYVSIVRGGTVHYGDSTKAAVAALNASRSIGLSTSELNRLAVQASVLTSKKFGVMFHGDGVVTLDGHTQLTTAQTAFLDKGQQVAVTVDGSQGASVKAANGVLFQLMENDDPGPVMVDGTLVNQGVYTEPTTAATKDTGWDLTATHSTDAVTTFKNATLTGDLYNAMRGDQNLVVTLDGTRLTGVISASTSKHALSTITSADYDQMGVVTDTAAAAVNNGVVVSLTGRASWQVTGTSYLTSLTVGAHASVTGTHGHAVTMTVGGVVTPIVPGTTYTGAIVLTTA